MSGEKNSRYLARYAKMAKLLCQAGATDEELADFFDVSRETIYNWKKKHKPFFNATNDGKIYSDDKVVESLYKRATGMTVTKHKFATHEGTITDSKEYEEEILPDVNAAWIWLRNRRPDSWKDKQEIHVTGSLGDKMAAARSRLQERSDGDD